MIFPDQTLAVENLDSASHWVNQYPVDKCQVNQLRYIIQWIEIYTADSVIHLLINCDRVYMGIQLRWSL